MEIKKNITGGKIVFGLTGRLDTSTAPALQEVLIPEFETAKLIELDFAELTYVSSAGLRVLLLGEKTAKAKGAELLISNVSAEIMEVLEMTGFSEILKIV